MSLCSQGSDLGQLGATGAEFGEETDFEGLEPVCSAEFRPQSETNAQAPAANFEQVLTKLGQN